MNAVELRSPDPSVKHSPAYMCSKCGCVFTRKYQAIGAGERTYTPEERDTFAQKQAERCCNHVCKICGEKAWGDWQVECRKHLDERHSSERFVREQMRYEKATKIPAAEWQGKEMLYCEKSDRWFRDLEEVYHVLAYDEDLPSYLWVGAKITTDPHLIENLGEFIGEEFHSAACDSIPNSEWAALKIFLDEWWKRNRPESYNVSYERCVVLADPKVAE